ncbi:MFS monocarboxylate transporter-like protein [Mollisia scopiformis]|uniref:MFS monocarboxylate transporter-like protein n=1 Tax=Mollisia scopiformis TaxID=149040 RepID=A0A194XNR0_MOLSC|nr:MFS monocarboxylate transporter-like protein [Mollisia scopiformis]KUJ21796.1 MFS monocarboxylate transporter-like protein [Mollisia scopiformis]
MASQIDDAVTAPTLLSDLSPRDEEPQVSSTESSDLRPITKQRQLHVLISAFLTICITIGISQSYGVFQSYYISPTQIFLPPNTQSNSAFVAFVGTLGYGLTWAGSIVVNPILARLDPFGTRLLCISGVLLMSLGFGLASLSTQVWHLLLTQGFLYGIGSSMLYFPILSSAPEYFDAHRGSAMGFILSGSGIGGLVFAPAIKALLSALGPRWTLRALSLIILTISLPIALTASPSRFVGRRPTHINTKLALKPAFLLSVGAGFLQAGGNGLPLTFISEYSIALGYTAGFGATLLAVMSGTNSVSRVMTGWAGDRWGRQNVLIVTVCMCVIVVLGFWLGRGYNSLFPTTIAEVFGLQAYASVNGFIYFVRGLGTMFGSPVGGKILGESRLGNYRNVVVFDAVLLGGAMLCVIGVRFLDAKEKRVWKWKA